MTKQKTHKGMTLASHYYIRIYHSHNDKQKVHIETYMNSLVIPVGFKPTTFRTGL